VPSLNKYANEPGYYIRALPSSVDAPITYQIESEGYSIIESYGLKDGEQISWSIIQSLKSLGLLYTDQSGVVGADEFEPDTSQLEETALDDDAARRLAEVIAENIDIDGEELLVILDILDIDSSTFDLPDTESSDTGGFPTPPGHSSTPEFPVHDNIDVLDGETIFKTDDWWKGVILAAGYNSSEILVYLWHKDGNSWKRKQKYKVKPEDWPDERDTIDRLVSRAD
jgi:hypothetical protein